MVTDLSGALGSRRARGRVALAGLLTAAAMLAVASGTRTSAADEDAGAPSSSGGLQPIVASGKVTPPDIDDVEHMCALLLGCDRLPISATLPKDFPTCVRTFTEDLTSGKALEVSLTLRECGLRASSCGQLRACALRGVRPDICAGRAKTGAVDVCDAEGRAVTCAREQVAGVRDCPRGGEQCAIVDGRAVCSLGACLGDAAPSCSASGTRVVECKSGRLVSLDCAALGMKCAVLGPPSERPACVAPTKECASPSPRCEGSVAVVCRNGHEVSVDCGAQGLECGGAGPAVGACTAPEPTCEASAAARCDGGRIRYCDHGRPRAYPCRALGLSRCVSDARGPRCAS